jgi:hypothetical protein
MTEQEKLAKMVREMLQAIVVTWGLIAVAFIAIAAWAVLTW